MIKFVSLTPECDPYVGSEDAAGFDLRLYLGPRPINDIIQILPGEIKELRTGVYFELPKLWCGLIAPRSSTGKLKIKLSNTIGVIDSDYRGEILVKAYNYGTEPQILYAYDRIVQMIVVPHYPTGMLEKVDKLSETIRGEKGWGSSGTN